MKNLKFQKLHIMSVFYFILPVSTIYFKLICFSKLKFISLSICDQHLIFEYTISYARLLCLYVVCYVICYETVFTYTEIDFLIIVLTFHMFWWLIKYCILYVEYVIKYKCIIHYFKLTTSYYIGISEILFIFNRINQLKCTNEGR